MASHSVHCRNNKRCQAEDSVFEEKHSVNLLVTIDEMRKNKHFVDVDIKAVNQRIFACHSAIVCAGSPFLENYIVSQSDTCAVAIKDISSEILCQLIEYIYTSKIIFYGQSHANELLQLCFSKYLFSEKSVEFACSDYLLEKFYFSDTSSNSSSNDGGMLSTGVDTGQESPPSEYEYHDLNHPLDLFKALNAQRFHSTTLTDVTFQVDNVQFPCHRFILCASSPYFKAMFSSNMREKSEKTVRLEGIEPEIFERILEYIYTSRLRINTDNAQQILEAASFIQDESVILAASKFLIGELHPSNCLGIQQFAEVYGCSYLHEVATSFALENFSEIVDDNDEFLDLSSDALSKLISNDRLNVKAEETVFEAVLNWVKKDEIFREEVFGSVLKHVRLPLIDNLYLCHTIEPDPLISKNPQCSKLVGEAKELKTLSRLGKTTDDPRLRLRFTMTTEVVVIVGGYTENQQWVEDVSCYDPNTKMWHDLAPFPGRNQRFTTVALGNYIYVIGGQAEHSSRLSETIGDVWRYDAITNSWNKLASLNTPRHGHGAAVLGGKIYVVGGKIGLSKRLNDMEVYDSVRDEWEVSDKIEGNYLDKPVLIAHGGKLAAIGYFFRDPDLMHIYEPTLSKWKPIESFERQQGDGIENAVSLNDLIYYFVYHGFNNNLVAFNPITGLRFNCHSMRGGKYLYNYGASSVGDMIFVVGGSRLDAGINITAVNVYDAANDTWFHETDLPIPLSEHGCVTIHKCMNPYTR